MIAIIIVIIVVVFIKLLGKKKALQNGVFIKPEKKILSIPLQNGRKGHQS